MTERVAVVLLNLGGPDGPESVQPFLFNLFNDPAIIAAPGPVRWLLARLISRRRAPFARDNYAKIGGGSPLLANTERQAAALEAVLKARWGDERWPRVFVAMRYWNPLAGEVARQVAAFEPDRVVLLPLYPQFSTTTTGSSLADWRRAARAAGLAAPASAVCCYPAERGFVDAAASAIVDAAAGHDAADFRLLFSAHGLPKKIVARGDPYQWQVEQTAAAIAGRLGDRFADWRICYQSRVGPLEWIGPQTEDEIRRAGADGKDVLVAPIAFVSEHSETLVELDIDYAELAADAGVRVYARAATVSERAPFVEGLADLVEEAAGRTGTAACGGGQLCPADWRRCALSEAA